MGRYRGSACKLCRREGKKLFLKGTRCETDKCALTRRETIPGGAKKRFRKRESIYATHLREKQKAKRIYGLVEHQFRRYFEIAAHKKGVTGELLLQLLERRLDNVVYRSGFAPSRKSARHLVGHGHFIVNDHKMDIPSYLVKPGDIISLKEKGQKLSEITDSLKRTQEIPSWLSFDKTNFSAKANDLPKREHSPADIREELIVELYSK